MITSDQVGTTMHPSGVVMPQIPTSMGNNWQGGMGTGATDAYGRPAGFGTSSGVNLGGPIGQNFVGNPGALGLGSDFGKMWQGWDSGQKYAALQLGGAGNEYSNPMYKWALQNQFGGDQNAMNRFINGSMDAGNRYLNGPRTGDFWNQITSYMNPTRAQYMTPGGGGIGNTSTPGGGTPTTPGTGGNSDLSYHNPNGSYNVNDNSFIQKLGQVTNPTTPNPTPVTPQIGGGNSGLFHPLQPVSPQINQSTITTPPNTVAPPTSVGGGYRPMPNPVNTSPNTTGTGPINFQPPQPAYRTAYPTRRAF